MALYSDVFRFRAEGAIVPWDSIRRIQDKLVGNVVDPLQKRLRTEATLERLADVQLRWMVAPTLGMPARPFHVYRRRRAGFPMESVPLRGPTAQLSFERVAAVVEVEVRAAAGARVLLSASRLSAREDDDGHVIDVREVIAAEARTMPASGSTFMRVRCSGATLVQVSAATMVRAEVAWLEDVLDLPDWEEIEIVGLPFEVGNYESTGQGMLSALTDPVSAAVERLKRGSPPIGWFPSTETGILAPDWFAPDPSMLIEEVSQLLAPKVEPLFDGRPAHLAALDELVQEVSSGSSLKANATIRPFDTLTLPSSAEAPLALTLGFGTAYTGDEGDLQVEESDDYRVVAIFDHEIPDSGGRNEIAAFIPSPALHLQLTAPQMLKTRNAGFTAPRIRDQAWKADVQAIWAQTQPSAALERPSGSGFARTDSGALKAVSLLPKREAGGPRPLLPATTTDPSMPPVADNASQVPEDRYALVDGDLDIPVPSGIRSMTHSVALVDLYGVWSAWEDHTSTIKAPIPPRPAIVDLVMKATFSGLPAACPTTSTIDVVLDWETRTPAALHLNLILFPTDRHGNSPGVQPPAVAAPPARPITMSLQFDGDELKPPTITPSGFTVDIDHLDEEGASSVLAGSDQGERRRRYRVLLTHTLNYNSTRWWGMEAWARTDLATGLASAWVPVIPAGTTDSADFHKHAMSTKAATPVPPVPPVVAQGPDVPLGSTQDSNGCSHTRIPVNFSAASVRKVSVWEVSEAALRTAGGLPQRADDTETPSERLVLARTIYDGLSTARRRSVFRRMLTVDAGISFLDVPLPRGSTDIHFFALTAITAEGVESAWPQGGAGTAAHEYLHTVISPRLLSPAAPELRVRATATGHDIQTSCLSRIPVSRFEIFATHSAAAARNARTMGFPVAAPVALLDADWTADPNILAEQGMRCYKASVTSTLEAGWNPWFLRAVAVPVEAVGQLGVRGMRSPDAPMVSFDPRPDSGPLLEPISGQSLATPVVTFNTATDAMARQTAAGSFQIRVRVESANSSRISAMPLADIPEVANPLARPSTIPGVSHPPLVLRGPRQGERIPIGIWWQRPSPDKPVSARITLTDPLGRSTHAAGTAPSIHVDPTFPIKIIGEPKIVGKSVTIALATKAPRDPDWILHIAVSSKPSQPIIRPRPVEWTSPLSTIAKSGVPITLETIQVRYGLARLPDPLRRETGNYTVYVRLSPPFSFVARLIDPRGQESTTSIEVKAGGRPVIELPPRRR